MSNLIVTILGLLALFCVPSLVIAEEVPDPRPYIALFASKFAVNEELLLDVAICESNLKQHARGDSGLAVGIFQFHQSTWDMFSKELGEDLDIHSVHDQAKLASWGFSRGYARHWTCWRLLTDLNYTPTRT